MAIQTRYAGDAFEVNNVDNTAGTTGTLIATGLTKNPIAIKIISGVSNFAAAEMATGGSVETILRNLAIDGTVVMYQVEAGNQMSVLLEASGAGSNSGQGAQTITPSTIATALQTRIQGLTANIGNNTGNIWANTATVVGSVNFKLATS